MPLQEIYNTGVLSHVGGQKPVLLTYHSALCGTGSEEIIAMFNSLSDEEEYSHITFLGINVDENPQARQYLEGKNACIISIYNNGRLLDTRYAANRRQVKELLVSLAP